MFDFDVKVVVPVLAAVFAVAVVIVGLEYNTDLDFGFIGFLSFMVVGIGLFGVAVTVVVGLVKLLSAASSDS